MLAKGESARQQISQATVVAWLNGCLVVWLFGCLVVWLFSLTITKPPDNETTRQHNRQSTDNEVHPRRDFVQGACFDDSDGIWDGVCANCVKGVADYLVSVFCLVVGEQDGVVSEVLLHEAVDIDAIVMPDGSLDGVMPDDFQRRHFR